MSQVYSTEPQTSGSVVFETTHGPLSIHLWCKECPHTVRFFLQLCLDGFYDGLVFHRIIPNFLIQTGDPQFRHGDEEISAKKQPPPKEYRQKYSASEALERRKYELNSRIRFNHRGQIAMALGTDDSEDDVDDGEDDDNEKSFARLQPQFFITLDEASHLDGKHVCFGGINGPTIFNALRIGQTDIHNEDDARNFQPRLMSEAPRILRVKILDVDLPPTLPALAPTQDPALLPWRIDPAQKAAKDPKKRKKKNRKGVKNINLLSFGEEMNDEDVGKKETKKIQSSHDVLTSKSLSKQKVKAEQSDTVAADTTGAEENAKSTLEPTEVASKPSVEKIIKREDNLESSESHNPTFSSRKDRTVAKETTNGSIPAAADTTIHTKKIKKDKSKKISLVQARRAKYANKSSNKKGNTKQLREDETMARFKAFQKKLTVATAGGADKAETSSYHGQVLEQEDSRDWIKTEFRCKRHMDQDAKGGDGRGVDDYKVIEERSSATDRKPGKRKRHHPA